MAWLAWAVALALIYLSLVAIVGENLGSTHPAKLFYTWYLQFSPSYPIFIVIGCVYMELLFLQSERELHWPGWSLDAISCAGWIWPTPHLLISTILWFHLEVQTQWSIEQGSEPHCRPFCHAVTVIPWFCKSYPVLKRAPSWNLVHAQLLPRLVNACVRQSRTSSLHSEVCMYQLSP